MRLKLGFLALVAVLGLFVSAYSPQHVRQDQRAAQATITFTDQDATPSVSGGNYFVTANTAGTTITTFDDGVAGQTIVLVCGEANAVADGSYTYSYTTIDGALTRTGMTIPLLQGDTLTWNYVDGLGWKQIDGSVGMGRYVPLSASDPVGDWIANTVVDFTSVDLSDDGVRKGAVAAHYQMYAISNGSLALNTRPAGASYETVVNAWNTNEYHAGEHITGLSAAACLEAKFNAVRTLAVNQATVLGYWI